MLPGVSVETGAAQQLRLVLPEHVVVRELQVCVRVCLRVRHLRVGVARVVDRRRRDQQVRRRGHLNK